MMVFWVILFITILVSVVGAVARAVNAANQNEMNNNAVARPRPRPPAPAAGGEGGGAARQSNSDMDRFLAEIDRLRKKNAEAPPQPANQKPAVPVVQPVKQPDRPRPRVVAELAEPAPRQDTGFHQAAAPTPTALPTAPAVVAPPTGTGAPATRVTRLVGRARPVAKTPFAKSLTGLLATPQGLAMAIVLQEILGPPKSRKA